MREIAVDALLTGTVAPFGKDGEGSAIAKSVRFGSLAVTPLGIAGDEQADLVHHGGADKAIHHYPRDHYRFWREALPDHPLLRQAGAFGENISTHGLTESEACIGDRFRLGTALVEISQGRQPCWKLGHRFAHPPVTAMVVKTGRSGWYYRVIETGQVQAGDTLALVDRSFSQWPVSLVFALLIGGHGKREAALVRDLCVLAPLAESWRSRASAMAS